MLKKIITITIIFVTILSVIGLLVHWYVNLPEYPTRMCVNNNLLVKFDDDEVPIYTKFKGLKCSLEEGIIIIEEIR